MLALTGTADAKMVNKIKSLLSMTQDVVSVTLSPERKNIKFTVVQAKRQNYFKNFQWIVNMIKELGMSMPKTIIFCNSMQDVANMISTLFSMLGSDNKMIGIFHSHTLSRNKEKVMDSFKAADGNIRVVIATSALSMGVNFPDVKFVVHVGPARSLVDHIQQAGRAGRNGEEAHNVIIYHGNQLAPCEKGVKEFVRSKDCIRQQLYKPFDSLIQPETPGHNCCSNCDKQCTCAGTKCDRDPLPFDVPCAPIPQEDSNLPLQRNVCEEDKETLELALRELKDSFTNSSGHLAVFGSVSAHGFSDELISAVIEDCNYIFTTDYLMSNEPIYCFKHAILILEIFNEIFEDIPAFNEIMETAASHKSTENTIGMDFHDYFDEPDNDSVDEDWVNVEVLENQ